MTTAETRGGGGGVLRWTARVLSLVALGLLVLFVVETGPAALMGGTLQGWPLALALLLSLAGLLLAWRWEAMGGLLGLLGALAVVGLVILGAGTHMLLGALLFAAPLLLAAALYLGCCASRMLAHTA